MGEILTDKDIEKIRSEITYRKIELRPKLLEALKEAREQGDLSENFEYYTAKREKNRNESRIRYLERILKTCEVITDNSADDEVGLNNTVTVYIEEDDEEETYKIVTSIRGDSLEGRISIDSPLGKALMHRKVGERVTVKVNDDYSYDVIIRRLDKDSSEDDDQISSY